MWKEVAVVFVLAAVQCAEGSEALQDAIKLISTKGELGCDQGFNSLTSGNSMFVRLGHAVYWYTFLMTGYLLIINFIYCFADKGCPCGSYQSEQSCYYVPQYIAPHEEAPLYCEALGYHLVTIGSAKENMVIKWIISEVVNECEYAIIH